MSAGLAVDTDTDLNLVILQLESGLSDCGDRAGLNAHAHGAHIGDNLLSYSLYFRKACAFFGLGACDLVNEDRAGNASAACCPCAVLNSDVVGYDDLLYLNVFVGCHISCHLEVHDITGVVLDDQKSALAALGSLDSLIDLVGSGGGEHRACNSAVQHSFSDKSAVSGLVSGAAAGDQNDLVGLLGACTDHNVRAFHALNIFGMRCSHSAEHLINYIVDPINKFLHLNTSCEYSN